MLTWAIVFLIWATQPKGDVGCVLAVAMLMDLVIVITALVVVF